MMITDERGDDKGNNIDDSNVDGDDESPKKSDDFDSKVLTLTLTGINCHPFIIALKIKNCAMAMAWAIMLSTSGSLKFDLSLKL